MENGKFGRVKNLFFIPFLILLLSCNSNESSSDEKMDSKGDVLEEENNSINASNTNSIYQVPLEWHSHLGDTLTLDTLKGKFPIMAMVFTNCGYACPRMVSDLKEIKKQIPPAVEDDVVFVLVSFDTGRDTPENLKKYAEEMQLDEKWLLLHGNEEEVRTLSMLLDVHYKKQESGDFAHSNKIVLLDKEGEIIAEVDGLGSDPSPIIEKLKVQS